MGKNKEKNKKSNAALDNLATSMFPDTRSDGSFSSDTVSSGKSCATDIQDAQSSGEHGNKNQSVVGTREIPGSSDMNESDARSEGSLRRDMDPGGVTTATNEGNVPNHMKNLISELQETKQKLQATEYELARLSSENEKLKGCLNEMNEVSKSMISRYDSQLFRLEKKLFHSSRIKQVYHWRPPFGPHLQKAIKAGVCPESFESISCFFPDSTGYRLKFELYGCGFGSGNGSHVSVYWRLVHSDNDDRLAWPFTGLVKFMLMPQDSQARPVSYETEVYPEASPFQRPAANPNSVSDAWGAPQFIMQTTALSPLYCRNNALVFQVTVEM